MRRRRLSIWLPSLPQWFSSPHRKRKTLPTFTTTVSEIGCVGWIGLIATLRHNLFLSTCTTVSSTYKFFVIPDFFLMAILPMSQALLPNEHWAHTANKTKRNKTKRRILLCHHSVPTQNASRQHLRLHVCQWHDSHATILADCLSLKRYHFQQKLVGQICSW